MMNAKVLIPQTNRYRILTLDLLFIMKSYFINHSFNHMTVNYWTFSCFYYNHSYFAYYGYCYSYLHSVVIRICTQSTSHHGLTASYNQSGADLYSIMDTVMDVSV